MTDSPITYDDPVDPAADESSRKAAFRSHPEWKNRPLARGLTIGTLSLFYESREAAGAPPLSKSIGSNAFLADALRLLWLCAADEAELEHAAADLTRIPPAVRRWAEAHVGLHDAADAIRVALEIWNTAHENRAEAAPGDSASDLGE